MTALGGRDGLAEFVHRGTVVVDGHHDPAHRVIEVGAADSVEVAHRGQHGLTEWPTVLAVETAHLDPTAVLTAPPAAHRCAAGEFAYRRDRAGTGAGGCDRLPEAAGDGGGDLQADIEAGSGARERQRHGSRGDPGSASDQACCVTHLEALRAADLRAVDLRGVDFRGVDFRGVDFCGVDFWGAVAGASAPVDR